MEYLILVLSLVGIVFGADYLVAGAVSIAKRYKVSDFVIGAAIVGVGTSMPELVVSFIGAIQGNADVAIGNVVGSNIFNVLFILGLASSISPISFITENYIEAVLLLENGEWHKMIYSGSLALIPEASTYEQIGIVGSFN